MSQLEMNISLSIESRKNNIQKVTATVVLVGFSFPSQDSYDEDEMVFIFKIQKVLCMFQD